MASLTAVRHSARCAEEEHSRRGDLTGLIGVTDPKIDRVNAKLCRQLVELRLDRERHLRSAIAAELSARNLVRIDQLGSYLYCLRPVQRAHEADRSAGD